VTRDLYEVPRDVDGLDDCAFYHSMEIPGFGEVTGAWDLRAGVDAYLGNIRLNGRRVLEIGPASGFLTFHMEHAGAEVVSIELPPDQPWDVVPAADVDMAAMQRSIRSSIEQTSNSYWLAHRAFGSDARVHRGIVDDLPAALGSFDIAVLSCVLLHMRDPSLALTECARMTTGSIIVTEPLWRRDVPHRPVLELLPAVGNDVRTTWWQLTPQWVAQLLGVLGFQTAETTYHQQRYVTEGRMIDMFTVVASR